MSYEEIATENKLLFEVVETSQRLLDILKVLESGNTDIVLPTHSLQQLKIDTQKRVNSNIRKMELPD